jgi:DNA polymerase III subunit epsilon
MSRIIDIIQGVRVQKQNKGSMKSTFNKKNILSFPNTPGVYLFFGAEDVLLYVGKSKTIRTRIRSHYAARDERWMMKRIHRIEARETAGELGAFLLESRLIKELRPMYNVRLKQPRRIIIARRVENEQGYATVKLEPVDYLDIKPDSPILGLFKHKTQAREFLDTIAKTHRLCPKLLRLENSRSYCFSYHLGQCDGACMGEEDVTAYNTRMDAAFEARRIAAWPFEGAVTIEEVSKDKKLHEKFVIDNWCLVANDGDADKASNIFSIPKKSSSHRFDYDSYKILYSYIMEDSNKANIQKANTSAYRLREKRNQVIPAQRTIPPA